jgi:hypothetical protein
MAAQCLCQSDNTEQGCTRRCVQTHKDGDARCTTGVFGASGTSCYHGSMPCAHDSRVCNGAQRLTAPVTFKIVVTCYIEVVGSTNARVTWRIRVHLALRSICRAAFVVKGDLTADLTEPPMPHSSLEPPQIAPLATFCTLPGAHNLQRTLHRQQPCC